MSCTIKRYLNFVTPWLFVAAVFFTTVNANAQATAIRMDSVSVNADGNVILGWTLLTELDDGYVEVHRLDNGVYGPIARVLLPQSFFIDSGANARIRAHSYYVVLYNSNDDVIGYSANDAHQTIFIKDITADICGKFIALEWSNYTLYTTLNNPVELPSPFEKNLIGVSFNGEEFSILQKTEKDIEQISFAADQAGQYCVFVRAVTDDGKITSTSNVKCINVEYPAKPEFLYIKGVNVEEENNAASISIYADESVPEVSWVIERLEQDGFVSLDTLTGQDRIFEYIDDQANVQQQSETYRITALDSCMAAVMSSQTVSSIFLTAQSISASENRLEWNAYTGWLTGVMNYVVQRRTDPLAEFIVIDDSSLQTYTDDLSIVDPNAISGNIEYRIVAVENTGNPFGFEDSVNSNVAIAESEIEVFIPTAFRPDSDIEVNRVFRPMFSFFSPTAFSMRIFTQWGQMVFTTDSHEDYWDGRHNGNHSPGGVYSYVLVFKDHSGKTYERRGTVLLLR